MRQLPASALLHSLGSTRGNAATPLVDGWNATFLHSGLLGYPLDPNMVWSPERCRVSSLFSFTLKRGVAASCCYYLGHLKILLGPPNFFCLFIQPSNTYVTIPYIEYPLFKNTLSSFAFSVTGPWLIQLRNQLTQKEKHKQPSRNLGKNL